MHVDSAKMHEAAVRTRRADVGAERADVGAGRAHHEKSLDFTQVLRFCISQKLACFALNFALIFRFFKFEGLTYKNLIFGEVSKRS